ncbi:MAG: hypothetical protein A2888_01155, partial [Chlamydiae bacterium RIFCSPLOWO2_01_FULL_28_7]
MDKRTILFVVLMAASMYLVQMFFPQQKTQSQTPVQKVQEIKTVETPVSSYDETFYVLKNDYLMLVFSSRGGALAEIDLPFKTKENQKSVINEILFDKKILKDSKKNAYFPLSSYYIFEDNRRIKKEQGELSGYFPLLRRKIADGKNISAKYYALNIVSDKKNIDNQIFKVTAFGKDFIEFQNSDNKRTITKRYSFAKDAPYTFDLNVNITGDNNNLFLTSGVPEVELTSGRNDPSLKLRLTKNNKGYTEKLKLPKNESIATDVFPDWICNSNGFMGLIIDSLDEQANGYLTSYVDGTILNTRLTLIDSKYNLYQAKKYPGYLIGMPISRLKNNINYRIFAGPFAKNILTAIDSTYSNAITGYNPEYVEALSFHGMFSFISAPFSKLMFTIMQLCYKITNSWGFSIILLTLILRLMLYPLNAWSAKSQIKMQDLGPQLAEIEKKYANNKEKLNMEKMRLMKEKGANPLLGCFPIFLQFPFLIGMFDLLKSSFELRGVSFISGWIDSLTSPDILFSWSYPIPFIGTEFHLLPIIMAATMFLQSKLMTKTKDTKQMTDAQRQQQGMTTILPIVFLVFFYKMPSGLNIYFLFSTI